MRLIDADVAIEELTDRSHQAAKRVGTDSPFWEGLVIARRIVNNLPTIQPEKTQLSQEGTTKDTISRQAALDCVTYDVEYTTERIKALPSLQPTCNQLAPDCISRQAAIDECNKRGAEHIGYAIAHLPTAQPEPQEGHWIRRDCGLDVECKCSRCGYKDFVEPRDEYWFNRNFCPNCGAKMKGERQK